MNCETLEEYLDRYGSLVADRARQAFEPLHVPSTDAVATLVLKRPMLPAQAHVATAAVKTVQRQKAVFLCCECGTGKSQMGACTVHLPAVRGKEPSGEQFQQPGRAAVLQLNFRLSPVVRISRQNSVRRRLCGQAQPLRLASLVAIAEPRIGPAQEPQWASRQHGLTPWLSPSPTRTVARRNDDSRAAGRVPVVWNPGNQLFRGDILRRLSPIRKAERPR